MNEIIIFQGKVKPELHWAGTSMQPRRKRDKFGTIPRGAYRLCLIDTKYGQLQLPPHKYGNKDIKIIIIKEAK